MKALAISSLLAALAGTARAEYIAIADAPREPSPIGLGARISIGRTAFGDTSRLAMSIGLGVEHPMSRATHVTAEYEWMWLLGDTQPGGMTPPPRAADGQRILVGLRHAIGRAGKSDIRWQLDIEGGAGVALVNDTVDGLLVMPTAYAGLRGGYALGGTTDSSSEHFEAAATLRAVATSEGGGILFGVGFLWE